MRVHWNMVYFAQMTMGIPGIILLMESMKILFLSSRS